MTNIWPLQKDCNVFYGNPGDSDAQHAAWESENLVSVLCPWRLNMDKIVVTHIRIHRKCADSLSTVLSQIWESTGRDQSAIDTLHLNHYSGSYNQRPMRGGTSRSMHGFGAAIDWDSEDNAQHAQKHFFLEDSLLVTKFESNGWVWGGRWGGGSIDAMHVQAARVHV